jgi:hypothetical protein
MTPVEGLRFEYLSAAPVPSPPGSVPISARRTAVERLRDAVDPLWRRMLWVAISRRTNTAVTVRRQLYGTSVTRLQGPAAERAREILARRLTP